MLEYYMVRFLAVAGCVAITMLLGAIFLAIFTDYFKDD